MNLKSFKTISSPTEGVYKEKGSKFFAYAFPISSELDFKNVLTDLKKEHHQARHHCYAFVLKPDKSLFRYSDDGEPSGTAGAPIYGQLQSFEVTNTAIIVVRYFGGTKLGVGGLIHAYREAAKDALSKTNIIEEQIKQLFTISFPYEEMNSVMGAIKKSDGQIISQNFDTSCEIMCKIPLSNVDFFTNTFKFKDAISLKSEN